MQTPDYRETIHCIPYWPCKCMLYVSIMCTSTRIPNVCSTRLNSVRLSGRVAQPQTVSMTHTHTHIRTCSRVLCGFASRSRDHQRELWRKTVSWTRVWKHVDVNLRFQHGTTTTTTPIPSTTPTNTTSPPPHPKQRNVDAIRFTSARGGT